MDDEHHTGQIGDNDVIYIPEQSIRKEINVVFPTYISLWAKPKGVFSTVSKMQPALRIIKRRSNIEKRRSP